jgi:hypothetical protein
MDGQARVAGQIYKDVEIGGKTYRLSKPNLVGIYGEVEAWIVSKKTDPLVLAARACKTTPASMHPVIWEAAMKTGSAARIASQDELNLFWNSRWSNAFMFMKALDDKHRQEIPDIETAMNIVEGIVDVDELLMQLSVVSGEADVKNSSGPSATRANQPMETPATEAGLDSTASSPKSTDGLPSK